MQNQHQQHIKRFMQLVPDVPFEQVIDWVAAAPSPTRTPRWKRWWKQLFS